MKCKACGEEKTIVKDSRTRNHYTGDEYGYVRRRRYCPACKSKFTTYETVAKEEVDLAVIRSLAKSILILLDSNDEV